jgi:hypothetical protein
VPAASRGRGSASSAHVRVCVCREWCGGGGRRATVSRLVLAELCSNGGGAPYRWGGDSLGAVVVVVVVVVGERWRVCRRHEGRLLQRWWLCGGAGQQVRGSGEWRHERVARGPQLGERGSCGCGLPAVGEDAQEGGERRRGRARRAAARRAAAAGLATTRCTSSSWWLRATRGAGQHREAAPGLLPVLGGRG